MKINAVVLLICAIALAAPAQRSTRHAPSSKKPAPASAAAASDEQAIADLENHIFAAIRDKKSSDLEPWLADDFTYSDAEGKSLNRDQYLSSIKNFPENIDWLGADHLQVHIFGNIALANGVKRMRLSSGAADVIAKPGGPAPVERRIAFTDLFRKRESDWELVLEWAAPLSPEPATPAPSKPAPPAQ